MDGYTYGYITVGDGADGSVKRGKARDSLLLRAELRFEGREGVDEVRVRNLSEGGMMVEVGRAVRTGTAVTTTMRGLGEVAGRVAWCTAGRVGIAFDEPIDPKKARKPVGTGSAAHTRGTPTR